MYLRIDRGKLIQKDAAALRAAALQPDTLAVIQVRFAPDAQLARCPIRKAPISSRPGMAATRRAWVSGAG